MNRRSFLKRASAAVPVAAIALHSSRQPEAPKAPLQVSSGERQLCTVRLSSDVSPGDIVKWDSEPWSVSRASSLGTGRLAGIALESAKAGSQTRILRSGPAYAVRVQA